MGGRLLSGAAGIALAATGVFSGGLLFISTVMHPAADKISYSSFAEYFRHMYPRALRVQGCLAALGLGAAGTAAAASPKGEARLLWSLSAALLAALAPYTLLVMIPAHDRVMQEEDSSEAAQQALLVEWGRKHGVRTVLSVAAFTAMITAVLRAQHGH